MRQQIDDLLPLGELPAGARVLDLGCGSGTIAYAGFPQLRFFGVDQYAHSDTGAWPPNACLILADAERLPWADGALDAVICNFVFEHFSEPRAALQELDRVIRPGGMLYVSIPRSSSLQDRLYRFTTKGGGHLQRYTFEKFVRLVYQETAFKLEGLALAPGGFTWLHDVPYGDLIRRLLYKSFRIWRQATGNNPLAASDFLLLFRLGARRGFKPIRQVCSHCGNSLRETPASSNGRWKASTTTAPPASTRLQTPAGPNGRWKCPTCAFDNILVSP